MSKSIKVFLLITTATLIIVLTPICMVVNSYVNNEKTVYGTVTDKYVKNDGDTSSYYVVVDGKPYVNTDSLIKGKFNSADIQAKIKTGNKVKMETYGFRNNFFSFFPNIKEVKQ
jgi:hypothetical protein